MALEFRKEALKKLSSPDDLDRLMPVTDARGWIALLAGGILLAAVIIWGFFGKIPVPILGEGITMVTGTVDTIFIRSNGILRNFHIKSGDIVQKGELLAEVEQPELHEEVEKARSESAFIQQHQSEREAHYKEVIESLSSRLERLKAFFKEGLVEKSLVITAEKELMNVKNDLYSIEEKKAEIDRHYNSLQSKYNWMTKLVAPYTGKVTEVHYNNGDYVSTSKYLLLLEHLEPNGRSSEGLYVYMYVSADNAKNAKRGMKVYISPSTVKPEEYGHIIGDVITVDDYPSTLESIQNDINEVVARKFTSGPPVYKIITRLQRDSSSYSGYRWTSGKGPHVTINSGTLCTGRIIDEEKRPVDLVIPVFKKYVLGEAR
ncbi:MAG: NHLP bacteriocin system secretion protein [Chlorobiaceae bacterium]